MLLSAPRQQELARLRVAVETQALVFFQNAVHRVAHAVFVVARLGFDRERDGGLRQFHRRVRDIEPLLRQRVAGQRVFQLGHRADIAGMQLRDRLQGLAVRAAQVRQPFRRTLVDVLQAAIVPDDARIHPEEVDPSGERIGRGLEDVGARQAAFGDRPVRFGAVDERRDLPALCRARHVVDNQIQDQVAADVVIGRPAHHRENAHFPDPRAHPI